jgi:hypothetical protein
MPMRSAETPRDAAGAWGDNELPPPFVTRCTRPRLQAPAAAGACNRLKLVAHCMYNSVDARRAQAEASRPRNPALISGLTTHFLTFATKPSLQTPLFCAAGFGIELDTLKKLILEKEISHSDALGGLAGIVKALKTDTEHGLHTKDVSRQGEPRDTKLRRRAARLPRGAAVPPALGLVVWGVSRGIELPAPLRSRGCLEYRASRYAGRAFPRAAIV